MLIKAYQTEILDGLENKLENNTVAFTSCITKSIEPTTETIKIVASFDNSRNFDLYYIQSILASIGPNKNDDWFLPEEMWGARLTPVHKQLNYMHDEKNIIGVITDSITLDANGSTILEESANGQVKDIATQAVIWTNWDDQVVSDNVQKIIASIEKDELYVSMEALFKNFDYMLVNGNETKIVARNEQTSFLTKHLRCYGSKTGEFDGYRVYRVLRDFTFSGKGIVDDPANPRSKMINNIFEVNKIISTKAENIMESDKIEKEIAELKSALVEANKTIASIKSEEAAKVVAEVENLKAQVTALKTLAEETQNKMDEVKAEKDQEIDKMKTECAVKVEEAEAELNKVKSEKIVAERVAKLVAANLTEEKAKDVVKTFASVSDELFKEVSDLYTKSNASVKTETVITTTVADAVETATASNNVENVEAEVKVEQNLLDLSKAIANKLNITKDKGDK